MKKKRRTPKADEEVTLEVVIDNGPGKAVPAEQAAEVIKGVVELLRAIETAHTGRPPEIVWNLKSFRRD